MFNLRGGIGAVLMLALLPHELDAVALVSLAGLSSLTSLLSLPQSRLFHCFLLLP